MPWITNDLSGIGATDHTLVDTSYCSTLLSAISCRICILRSFHARLFLPPSARIRRHPGNEPPSVPSGGPARWVLSPEIHRAVGFCTSEQRDQRAVPVRAAPAPQELPELTPELDLAPATVGEPRRRAGGLVSPSLLRPGTGLQPQ